MGPSWMGAIPPRPSLELKTNPYFHVTQQPSELAPLVRPQRMWPRIDGKLGHISSSFRLRVSRTLPRRLCIARNRCCTRGERIQTCP